MFCDIGCWFHTLLIYFCYCFSGGLDVGRWSRGGSERGVFLAVEWFWRLRALGRAKQEVNGGSLFRGGERLWRMWTWRGFQDWALKLALGCAVCFIYWRPWGGQCHGDTGVKHLSWFMETLHWRERFWWMRDGTWDAFQIGFSSELRDCVSMVWGEALVRSLSRWNMAIQGWKPSGWMWRDQGCHEADSQNTEVDGILIELCGGFS